MSPARAAVCLQTLDTYYRGDIDVTLGIPIARSHRHSSICVGSTSAKPDPHTLQSTHSRGDIDVTPCLSHLTILRVAVVRRWKPREREFAGFRYP